MKELIEFMKICWVYWLSSVLLILLYKSGCMYNITQTNVEIHLIIPISDNFTISSRIVFNKAFRENFLSVYKIHDVNYRNWQRGSVPR